jgi:predicted TIM-barrel fold metal-dependent hydrolase
METRSWLEPFIEPEFAGKLQPVLGEQPGRIDRLVAEARLRNSDPIAAAKAAENPIAGPKGWSAYGAFDPSERKQVMDTFGFSSQLVFPTAGLVPMKAAPDEASKCAASRAYNRAIAAFCAGHARLIAIAYVPLDNLALALEGAKEALAAGCGAVMFSNAAPGDRSPGHPAYDPFWQLLCESDVPFMLHIGQGTLTQPQAFSQQRS